jgi:FHA domain
MGNAGGALPGPLLRAEIGQIGVERAAREAEARLLVTIPVSTQVPRSWKDRVSLSVTAVLRVPPGFPAPVAYTPTPEPEYLDGRTTMSGSAGLAAGVVQLSGGLSRPVGAEDLVVDVTRTSTDQVTWTIDGRHRELAGSHEFGLAVDETASRFAWMEVTAQLKALKGRSFRRQARETAPAALAVEPLIARDAPQAGTTVVLYEGDPADGHRFFVGRPLDLPLAVQGDSFAVPRGRGAPAAGAIRWADDADGRPGYTWTQFSTAQTVKVAGPRRPDALILPGNELGIPGGMRLTVTYDVTQAADWAVGETSGSALDVDVVIDGTVIATHTTQADYVTVGRTHRDICIDRPEISRSHGAFQFGPDGWTYCQLSSATETQVIGDGQRVTRLRQDGIAPVAPGDTVRLTPRVSLVLR